MFRVLNLDLVGLDNAWRASIEPNDENVALQAIEFINKLHKTVCLERAQFVLEPMERANALDLADLCGFSA